VGDFNQDGAPDVAINGSGRNYTSQYVSRVGEFLVLLNDGTGKLGTVSGWRRMSSLLAPLIAADVNGDGHLDAFGGSPFGAYVLLGQGDGGFIRDAQRLGSSRVSSLGVWTNGSGTPLLWSLDNFDSIDMMTPGGFHQLSRSSEGGSEARHLSYPNGQRVVGPWEEGRVAVVADFNEDGLMDVVFNHAVSTPNGSAQIFIGDVLAHVSAGGLLPLSQDFTQLETADFNGDGHQDLLALTGATLWSLLGDGNGGFSVASSLQLDAAPQRLAITHLDADGIPDAVAVHTAMGAVSLLRGAGNGTFVAHGELAVGRAPTAAIAADLGGDGIPELLVTEADDNAVSVYAIPKQPVHEPRVPFTCALSASPEGSEPLPPVSPVMTWETGVAGTGTVAVGDFNGDGRKDFALADPSTGVRIVGNPQGKPVSWSVFSGQVQYLAAGDFDGDGREDLAFSSFSDEAGILWNDPAEEPFSSAQILKRGEGGGGLVAADFNGDGHEELAVTFKGSCTGSADLFTHQGNRQFRAQAMRDFNPEPDDRCYGHRSPVAGDFNGDGTLDFVDVTLGINLQPLAPDGTLLPGHGFQADSSSSVSFEAVDADGNGTLDLVSRSPGSGSVRFFPGDGHATLQAPWACALPTVDSVLTLEDLNADGLADLTGTTQNGTRLWVLLGTRGGKWGPPRPYSVGGAVSWVKPVDVLGDAGPELVVLSQTGRLHVFPTPAP
jgi:hypothetical protein